MSDAALRSSPLLLAVESATARLSVALLRGSELLVERSPATAGHHAEALLPLIESVLAETGVRESEIEAFAVSIGPGSFTSLRVGLATLKGLAFGSGRPLVPVPTLTGLAWPHRGAAAGRPVAALLDARRGEAYAAVLRFEGEEAQEQLAPGLFAPRELAPKLPEPCLLVGEGALLFGDALRAGREGEVRLAADAGAPPRAASIGALAAHALARGDLLPEAADLAPRYGRRAQAELAQSSRPKL